MSPTGLYNLSFASKNPYTYYISPEATGDLGNLGGCLKNWSPPSCPNFGDKHGDDNRPQPEKLDLYLVPKSQPCELMWYTQDCVIKQELVEVFEAEAFTGVEFRPVNLYRGPRCSNPLEGYVEMRVSGRVAADEEKSGIRIAYQCPLCGATRYTKWSLKKGLHLKGTYEEWPEVFKVGPSSIGMILVKERFAQFVMAKKYRQLMLTRFDDYLRYSDEYRRSLPFMMMPEDL